MNYITALRGSLKVFRELHREFPALRWAFGYFFALLTGYYVLRPVRDAMGAAADVEAVFPPALIGWFSSRGIALGDFSTVLAGAPALLGQLAYSRDAEREADGESLHLLRANGIPPSVMVVFFEQARAWRDSEAGRKKGADFDPGIALASHPADDERIAFFRDAAPR